ARIMMGFLYISSGIPKLLAFSRTVDKMSDLGLMLPSITAEAVVVIEVIGAIMIITGFFTRVTILILCLYTIAASIIGH
ncbi:DoxX family protein, partial [Klebsiella pneumoniae]|uniref:DoxX family protein n=1 Tax=Klebsiella pneumoniae TaxID=573 RepID=UPI002731AEB4